MKSQDQHLIDSLNKILNLQIDAIHELLDINSIDTSNRHNALVSILKRKQMLDQLMMLILSRGGRIDYRINTRYRENGYTTNDQLMELYRDIVEDKRISGGMKTTLSKHYELISWDLVEMAK